VQAAALLFLIGNAAAAQSGSVQNAAGEASGSYLLPSRVPLSASFTISPSAVTSLAPGSLAIINYYSPAYYSPAPPRPTATVVLRPVGSASTIPAQVVATDSSTITFVVPPQTPAGPAQLVYHVAGDVTGGITQWIEISVVPASFALFRKSAPGPAQAQLIAADGSSTLSGMATPAKPGQMVVLWGSGLGATPMANVGVTLGGVPQTVLYAGRSPSVPGVDQINFRVAAGTPAGCYVPLAVIYGQLSASSYLSESSDGSPCAHPLRLSADDLRNLDTGGTVAVGRINLESDLQAAAADHASRSETAAIAFSDMDAALLANYFGAGSAGPPYGCSLPGLAVPTGIFAYIILGGGPTSSFGSTMTLTGPSQSVITLTSPSYSANVSPGADAPLSSVPPAVLSAGSWTWASAGGQNLPASSFDFTLPPPVRIDGSAPIALALTEDQTIAWNGANYDPNAIVTVTLTSTGPYAPAIPVSRSDPVAVISLTLTAPGSTLLTCTAPANAGRLTIPKDLLSQIGPTVATLSVQVSEPWAAAPHALFKQTNGKSLSIIVSLTSSDNRPVDIQ
jgi:uncharacterized protein (TIGR03437 family)